MLAMTIDMLKLLSPDAQAKLTWEEGVFLGYREHDGKRYVLYQLQGFYIEFHYHMAGNKILSQLAFGDVALLDAYFEQ